MTSSSSNDTSAPSASMKYLTKLMGEFRNTDASILIYGCNGFTATIILRLLRDLDFPAHQIVFAARNPVSLTEALVTNLSEKYSKIRVVTFSAKEEEIERILNKEKFSVILNCAGPFSETARQFISLCAAKGVSYVDITGEVDVFEYVLNNPSLKQLVGLQQNVIMPGVGFDVVPSDCLLKKTTEEFQSKYNELPHKLELMIVGAKNSEGGTSISHGTKKTMVRGFMKSQPVTRLDGKLQPPVEYVKNFPVRYSKDTEVTFVKGSILPWGDISTGYFSTRVPNIHTYMPGLYPNKFVASLAHSFLFSLLLRIIFSLPLVLRLVDWGITRAPIGPSETSRMKDTGSMYAVATSKDGSKKVEKYLLVKEGYQLTAETALASTLRIATRKCNEWGCVTPSRAFGCDYILNFDKCEFFE